MSTETVNGHHCGETLRLHRHALKLTQSEMATRIGVSAGTMHRLERSATFEKCTATTRRCVAEALKVSSLVSARPESIDPLSRKQIAAMALSGVMANPAFLEHAGCKAMNPGSGSVPQILADISVAAADALLERLDRAL